jgi:ABC-type branched-subunit amino acid transport system substrate-binding protein
MLAGACLLGCASDVADDAGIPIGALIPFTGVSAASGSNYERAMLLAIDELNRQTQGSGQRFRLVSADSHSTAERTLAGLRDLLREDVFGLLGPDDVELAKQVRANLEEYGIAHVLPSSVTLTDFSTETSGLLTRPAPAAEFVGCALANRVYGDLNERMAVIHAGDPYRRAFADAAVRSFESYGFAGHRGQAAAFLLPGDSTDYLATISAAAEIEPDTVVLAADTPVAAAVVRAWSS